MKKKNYKPKKHKNSYTLNITKKKEVFPALQQVEPYLRVMKKRKRAQWILNYYDSVTVRNGKYIVEELERKLAFEREFFRLK